jgi:hypothetical protein
MCRRSSREHGRIDLYEVATGIHQMREGFRMYWFRSSEKARQDWNEPEDKIASALDQLRALADPARKKKPKTEKAIRKKATRFWLVSLWSSGSKSILFWSRLRNSVRSRAVAPRRTRCTTKSCTGYRESPARAMRRRSQNLR